MEVGVSPGVPPTLASPTVPAAIFNTEEFRIFYLRNSAFPLSVLFVAGFFMQLLLSHMLSPFGGKSRTINSVYVVYLSVALYSLQSASKEEQLSRYTFVGVPSSAVLSLTRLLRGILITRGSADDAAAWLDLGRGENGLVMKAAAVMLMGLVLTMTSADLEFERRVALVATPEALRLKLLWQAAVRAGGSRRIAWFAAKQAVVCCLVYLAGVGLAALHEMEVRRVWSQIQSLEARCAWPKSTYLDQHCFLALFRS